MEVLSVTPSIIPIDTLTRCRQGGCFCSRVKERDAKGVFWIDRVVAQDVSGTSNPATLVYLLTWIWGLQGVSREKGLAKGFWEFMEFKPVKRELGASESP